MPFRLPHPRELSGGYAPSRGETADGGQGAWRDPWGGMFRRCAIAVALLLATPAAAAVRPAPGVFAGPVGKTRITFRAMPNHTLKSLRVARLAVHCSDGSRSSVAIRPVGWNPAVRGGRVRSRKNAREGNVRGFVAFTATFTSRNRARGTVRIRWWSATGPSCDSGARSFTARRRGSSAPAAPARPFAGKTVDGSVLRLAMTAAGDGVRPTRMRAKAACSDGGAVTLDVTKPAGGYAAVTDTRTFSGTWKFTPPPIPGRAAPSGGAILLSGRVTASGLDGAARLTWGFMDGSSCDSGWQRFTIAGNTAAG